MWLYSILVLLRFDRGCDFQIFKNGSFALIIRSKKIKSEEMRCLSTLMHRCVYVFVEEGVPEKTKIWLVTGIKISL